LAVTKVQDALVGGERSGGWNAQAGRTYTNTVYVETDDPTTGPREVLLNLGIKIGDTYRFPMYSAATETDSAAYIQSAAARMAAEDGRGWIVTIEYGPFNAGEQGGADQDGTQDPTKIPPKVHTGVVKYDEAVLHDTQTGKSVLNTAGLPFDPPLVRPVSNSVWTITRNEATWDGTLTQYCDSVNSEPFLGLAPNTVKLNNVSAERQYQADFGYYWEVTYEFEVRPIIYAVDANGDPINEDTGLPPPDDVGGPLIIQNGWTDKVLNAGLLQKNTAGDATEHIIISGSPVSQPVQLNNDGRYDPEGEPVYLDVNRFPAISFQVLGIPEDLLSQGPPPDATS
jgi:hypothetical protein